MGNRIAWYVLALLLVGGAVGLFWVQNGSRSTQLSFDIGFAAWELREPVQIPALILTCLGVGALLGGVPMWMRSWRLSARVSELEQQVAVAEVDRKVQKEPGTW